MYLDIFRFPLTKNSIWTCPDLLISQGKSWIWKSPDLMILLWKIYIWTCPDLIILHWNDWIWTCPDIHSGLRVLPSITNHLCFPFWTLYKKPVKLVNYYLSPTSRNICWYAILNIVDSVVTCQEYSKFIVNCFFQGIKRVFPSVDTTLNLKLFWIIKKEKGGVSQPNLNDWYHLNPIS